MKLIEIIQVQLNKTKRILYLMLKYVGTPNVLPSEYLVLWLLSINDFCSIVLKNYKDSVQMVPFTVHIRGLYVFMFNASAIKNNVSSFLVYCCVHHISFISHSYIYHVLQNTLKNPFLEFFYFTDFCCFCRCQMLWSSCFIWNLCFAIFVLW